jgi:hypothetical protein
VHIHITGESSGERIVYESDDGAGSSVKAATQTRKEVHMSTAIANAAGKEQSRTIKSGGNPPGAGRIVAAVLATWFGLVVLLGIQGAFFRGGDSPPLPVFFGFATPLTVFFAAYFRSSAFRAFVLGIDIRLITAVQAWRWAGFGFLSLYAYGVLPGLFAFPAGLGDIAVGIVAPWMVLGLIREPWFATGGRFLAWNIMGIVDLVVAVSMGALCSGFLHGFGGNVTAGAMSRLPLVLIPAFFVPIFIMLHFTALSQARRLARAGASTPAQEF